MATRSSTAPRGTRRSSSQIRELLLIAATTLFERQGYHATTTQQIVEDAGVDAPTLYRHFHSKAELFEETMLGPLQEFLAGHAAYWSSRPLGEVDPPDLMRRYATGLVNMLHAHRDAMRTLVTASRHDDDLGQIARRVSAQFTEGLVAMKDIVVAEGQIHRFPGLNSPDATIAASTGMILSMVLFDDWVFPNGRRPGKAKVIDEITAMVLYGVTRRPDA